MQKRLAPLVITGLTVGALPFLWLACSAPQVSQTAESPTGSTAVAKLARPSEATFHGSVQPFLQTYCVSCHGGKQPEAELDLSSVKAVAAVTSDPARWNMVLERLRDKEMPPDDAEKIPTDAQRETVVSWLESAKAYETQRMAGDPGIVLARRLSNAEYDYTIRDLTGVDIRPTKEFPVDPANAAGFDNTGESLAMSPALVTKYLEAARKVSDHLLFTPNGLSFAPYPAISYEDRAKYATNRIVAFYRAQGVNIATQLDNYMAQSLDYADFFAAAWRFQHRTTLGRSNATLDDFAKDAKLSPKYLATLWTTLTTPAGGIGPIAALQARWKNLPAPSAGAEPASLRDGCVAMRDFVLKVRPLVRMKFPNAVPRDNIVAAGSQTMVYWKNKQYAANRTTYDGNALELELGSIVQTDPAMTIPTADDASASYNESFKRFCAVFPDAFVVYERARMFIGNQRTIQEDLAGHRYLSAGLHSQVGYFRDDKPLYDLVLDTNQQRELDQLWAEFNFITEAPFRQIKEGFVWFETAEPPSVMINPVFAEFRAADDSLLAEAKFKRFGDVYYSLAAGTRVAIPPPPPPGQRGGGGGNIALNYRPQPLGPNESVPEGFSEFKLSPTALQAIRDYFAEMNTRIRDLEKERLAAEPHQLNALVAFAERGSRRPLAQAEKDDLLAFYAKLRAQQLSHEDAIRDSIVAVLMSPAFTYRYDLPKVAQSSAAAVQPLSDYQLANRLSYFLWSSMPDDELLSHANAGDLHQPEVLKAQAKRMLRDAKIRGFATEFGGNWLDVRRFEEHNAVDRERFPVFTNELREAMFQEPVRFIVDLVQQNGSVLDFIYGDHTFVNPVLAKHYGMPVAENAGANSWVRIDGASKYERGGLLPMAAFLTKYAPGLRTSPVKRGHWVVTKLLGERIPAPPPNIPVLPTDETKMGDLTVRQTLAKHRDDKACASCHNKIDSFGLVFEGFGPVGEVRKIDLAERPVETNAVFPDGSQGDGLAGLKNYIHTKVEHEFLDNLCRKMLSYALGRTLIPSDDLVVASMRQKLSANANRFDSMVEEIVTSRQFLTKRNSPDSKEGT